MTSPDPTAPHPTPAAVLEAVEAALAARAECAEANHDTVLDEVERLRAQVERLEEERDV